MSRLRFNKVAAPPAPAAGKVEVYASVDTPARIRSIDEAGNDMSLADILNASQSSQSIPAATRTYITGSKIAIPAGKLKVGTILRWTFNITKTAAGTAASTYDIAVGTSGSVSDTARCSFTKPAGTAVVDEGFITIIALIRSIGATGVMVAEFMLIHNLSATGHATIPCVVVNSVSGGFDMTVAGLNVGICITSGASDAITIQLVTAEAMNL